MNKRGFIYVPAIGGGGGGVPGGLDTQVQYNNAGAFAGDTGFVYNATNKTITLGGATVTASAPVLDLSQTWNNAAVPFTGLKFNVTNTASNAASLLADLQVGGVSRFRVTQSGSVVIADDLTVTDDATFSSDIYAGSNGIWIRPGFIELNTNSSIWFTGSSNPGISKDLSLLRDAANTLAQRNGANAQTSRIYGTYTDASNYERLSLSASPVAGWMQVAAETAGTGTDNIGIALTPAGTGAISAHVPDSTAAGGNARGSGAVDWQTTRIAAAQVASGQGSTIGGGEQNTASGAWSCVAGGYRNIASGDRSWIPGGRDATTRGLTAAYAYASSFRAVNGDAQVIGQLVRRTTSDATPISLATDGATISGTTVMVIPASSMVTAVAVVGCRDTAGNAAGFEIKGVFKRDGANNTTIVGTATVTTIAADAALATATCTLVANNTLESVEIQVTGVAATTIYWVGELKCIQVA
jgi:hypothetical protein